MKRRLAVFVLSAALACGAGATEPKPAPAESVAQSDWLALQLAESQVREASLRLDLARTQLTAKYHIEQGDEVDPKTLVIRRASKAVKK